MWERSPDFRSRCGYFSDLKAAVTKLRGLRLTYIFVNNMDRQEPRNAQKYDAFANWGDRYVRYLTKCITLITP